MFDSIGEDLAQVDAKGSKSVAKFNFTKKAIDAIAPTGKRVYYHDQQVRGLTIAVDPSGRKTFLLYSKVHGKPERIKIGTYPDMAIDRARAQAHEMKAGIARGENPAQKRREIRAEMTLQELFDSFLLLYAKVHKRTWKADQWMFEKYLHGWRLKKLSSITRRDVITLHVHIGRTHGQYSANRAVELLCSMFNRAIADWGYVGINPAHKVKPFKERKRERFLEGPELPAFFNSLNAEPNTTIRDFFWICLLTGARRSNCQEMLWTEIDWTRRLWNIPAEKAKEDEPIAVILTQPAIELLLRRQTDSLREGKPLMWVFPGKGKTGHLVEPREALNRILDRAGLSNVRIHDLRRTLASWQALNNSSLLIIGRSLGDKDPASAAIYARLNNDPVRDSVGRATVAMLAAGGVK